MGKTNFDQLMKRYLTGKVTEQERIKIETWLEINKTGSAEDLELTAEQEERIFQKIISQRDNLKEIQELRPEKRRQPRWILGIAAALPLLVASYLIWNYSPDTNASAVEKVILNDGTLVWLRNDSKLIFNPDTKKRTRFASLQGNALFEVAKDPDNPFVIQCGDLSITVVGTSFNVKSTGDTLELHVLTGRVNLSLRDGESTLEVNPNEKVSYTGNGILQKQALPMDEFLAITASTEYRMDFSNTTLAEITQGLEKKFNTTITLENQRAADCRLTIDLTDHSLTDALNMISEVLDITYQQNDKNVTIAGDGCN